MAIKMFYELYNKHVSDVASASAPDEISPSYQLVSEIANVSELPYEFSLTRLTESKNGLDRSADLSGLEKIWLDYQPNSLAWPFFSIRLKELINKNLTGKEGIDWVIAKVNGNGESRDYYIPRFSHKLDVLSPEKTTFIPGTDDVLKPCFAKSKVEALGMFHGPTFFWQITINLFVNKAIRDEIVKSKLTGLNLEKVWVD